MSYTRDLSAASKNIFNLDILGFYYAGENVLDKEHAILRKKYDRHFEPDPSSPEFFYLFDLDFTGNYDEKFNNVDVLTIKSLKNIKHLCKKLSGKNIGMEFLISDLRSLNNYDLGNWFFEVEYAYRLCKKYDFQFVLSSGASNFANMASSKIFNIILKKLKIESFHYWIDLNSWLYSKRRGIVYDII